MTQHKELGKRYYQYITANRGRDLTPEIDSISDERLLGPLKAYIRENYYDVPVFCFMSPESLPYSTVEDLRKAMDTQDCVPMPRYTRYTTPCQVSPEAFTEFRALHDFVHHYLHNLSYSPFDEFRAAMHLVYLYQHDKLAQSFVFSNVGAMNAVYEWSPSKWSKLNNYTDNLCLCPDYFSLSPHRNAWGNV